MTDAERLTNGLEIALIEARAEYRAAVIEMARHEANKADTETRELADVNRIHHARTRVIALEAAGEELARAIKGGTRLD